MNEVFKPTGRVVSQTLLFLLVLVAGCKVDQKKDVASYRKVLDGPKPVAARVVPGKIVTLTDAIRLANQNNESLAIQGETYVQALIAKDREFSAFFPTLAFSPSFSFTDPKAANNANGGSNHYVNAPFVVNWNLFNGGRDVDTLKREDLTIEQQRQLVLDLQQTILLEVVQTYYQVLTNEQSVEVLGNSVVVQQARVDQIRAQSNVGMARPLDVAQAEAQLSQTRVSLLQAQSNVRNSRTLLAFLVDAPLQGNPLSDDYLPPEVIPTADSFVQFAQSTRNDYLAAHNATLAARKNVNIIFAEYYPTVNFNLNALDLSAWAFRETPLNTTLYSGVISANLPLFTATMIHDDVRNAWSLYRQAAMTEHQLRRQIESDVGQGYENLQLARRELNELRVEVNAAKQALFLADQQYLNGRGTLLDRLIAQDTLLSSQLQLTTAQFTTKTAYLNLLRLIGQLSMYTGQIPATQPTTQPDRSLATQPVTQPGERLPMEKP